MSRDPRLDVAVDAASPSSNHTCGFPAYGFPLSDSLIVTAFVLSFSVNGNLHISVHAVNTTRPFSSLRKEMREI